MLSMLITFDGQICMLKLGILPKFGQVTPATRAPSEPGHSTATHALCLRTVLPSLSKFSTSHFLKPFLRG